MTERNIHTMSILSQYQNVHTPYCLITDILSEEQITRLEGVTPKYPERVIIAMDHNTPCGTVAVAERQKRLMDYARAHGTVFYYGQGIGYYLAMEKHLQRGDVLLGAGTHVPTVGAVGALGLSVPFDTLLDAVSTGSYPVPEAQDYVIRLNLN